MLGEVSGSPSASGIASLGNESKKQVVGTKWTTVLGGASLNEVHFGYSDTKPEGETPLSTRDWSALLFRPDRQFMGELNVPGLTSIGYRTGSSSYRQRAYALKEGFSLIRGNHSYRAGGEWTYYRYNVESCSRGCQGVYEFSNMENFLLGVPRRFEVMLPGGDDPFRDLRQHLIGTYVQDNWQARPDVTLNLGLGTSSPRCRRKSTARRRT